MKHTILIDAKPKFIPLQVVATPKAAEILMADPSIGASIIHRHTCGDWGDMCDSDKELNDLALEGGDRVMSVFESEEENIPKIYVITEWDRSVCTIMLPDEY